MNDIVINATKGPVSREAFDAAVAEAEARDARDAARKAPKARKVTFSVIKGTGVRRNAETGVEIRNDGPDGWAVRTFHADKGDLMTWHGTFAEARVAAIAEVEMMRTLIAEAYDEALADETVRETLAAARAGSPVGARPGLLVRFRTTFSAVLNGTEYEVVGYPRLDATANKFYVDLRIVGTKMTRTGYLADLRTLSTGAFVSYS